MKKLIVTFLISLLYNISSAQSGWGYVNYTSYKLFNGNGSTSQYQAFPNTAAEFDNMLNTANSNTPSPSNPCSTKPYTKKCNLDHPNSH